MTYARWFGLVLLLSGCSGNAGSAVRPQDPTLAGATGDDPSAAAICHKVNAEGTPLIVDWKPEERGDLEVAMKKGVAIVHYDCNSIKLLSDCRVDGAYDFVGMSKKEELITLANADEAKANLPLNGATIGGALTRGSSLDIGLFMIGKKMTAFPELKRDDLAGSCDGATHFVRSATVGAFAMKTATAGEVKVAAQVFSIGASGDSSSSKSVSQKDGDIDACGQADPDSPKPPKGCAAPVRIQLLAIGEKAPPKDQPQKEVACPSGLTAVGGKCAVIKASAASLCAVDNLDPCDKQCTGGSADDCSTLALGLMLKSLQNNSNGPDVKLLAAQQRGCDLGEMFSCYQLGDEYMKGVNASVDVAKGISLLKRACYGGSGDGCLELGNAYGIGKGVPKDGDRSMALYTRACNMGVGQACMNTALVFSLGVPGDPARATRDYRRACDAGTGEGCFEAGAAYEKGVGVTANPALAASFYKKGCAHSFKKACDKAR